MSASGMSTRGCGITRDTCSPPIIASTASGAPSAPPTPRKPASAASSSASAPVTSIARARTVRENSTSKARP